MQVLRNFWQRLILPLRFLRLQWQVQQLHQQGLYQQAIELATETLILSQSDFRDAHFPEIFRIIAEGFSLNNLAELHREQGHYSEAEPLLRRALELWRSLLGNKHTIIASILNNLANLYQDRGCYKEAEDLYLEVLDLRRSLLGNKHPAVATSLNNLATLYYSQGRYSEAESFFSQALELQQRLLGDNHLTVANSLNNLAALNYVQGHYDEAKTLYEQALDLKRRLLGNEHPAVAVTLNNLAELHQTQGRYSDAETLLEQALDLKRRLLGNEHPAVADSLNNLAELHQTQGRYSDAETLHSQAFDLRRRLLGDRHPAVAESLHNLASLYKNQGRYGDAEILLKQALELNQQLLGNEHPAVANSLNNLANLYRSQGRYNEAKTFYEQALDLRRHLLGDEHPDVAQSLSNLALLYSDQGCYSEAVVFSLQAMELWHRQFGGEHPDMAASLNNFAVLYGEQGRYDEAVFYYLQALELELRLGDGHPGMAATLNNLANLCQELGIYSAAEGFYERALDLRRRQLGDEHPDVATSLDGLANLYHHQKRYTEAKTLYEQALDSRRRQLGDEHPAVATSLNNLAGFYTSQEQYDEAEILHRQALDLKQRILGNEHPDVVISLSNLARLLALTNRFTEAFMYMLEATKIEDHIIGQVFATSSENDRLAYLQLLRANFDWLLSLIYENLSHSTEAMQAALDLVLKRKALTTSALASLNQVFSRGSYPHLTSEFQQLKSLSDQIIHLSFSEPEQGDLTTYQQRLRQLQTQHNTLQRRLALQVPEIRLQEQLQAADCRTVALELPEGTALVEFVQFFVRNFNADPARDEAQLQSSHYLAFILLAKHPDQLRMIPLGPTEEIDRLIQSFRLSVLPVDNDLGKRLDFGNWDDDFAPKTMQYNPVEGIKLRQAIFDPIHRYLDKDHKYLLIAPDGELNLVPFQILPIDEKGKRLLMDEYNISYLSVGREVLRSKVQSIRPATTPIVMADPDFDLEAERKTNGVSPPTPKPIPELLSVLESNRLSRALGTKFLGEGVAKKLKDAQLYLRVEALETHLKNSQSPSIMLIATHGIFLPSSKQKSLTLERSFFKNDRKNDRFSRAKVENPMIRSGLALAGANTWLFGGNLPSEAGKGFVFAEEVAGIDLWATELVVMSACDTARGDIKIGEGVFGLRRAFAVAGAKSLVMSLWKVPDKATALLMDRFFNNLQHGCGRAEALQEAQNYIRAITVRELRQSLLGLEVLKELLGVRELESRTSLSCSEDDTLLEHPFYWGAWICQGDASPLKSPELFKTEAQHMD